MSRTINRRKLTNAEVFNLTTWYAANKERLHEMTDGEIRTEAAEVLKIEGLTDAHLMGVRKTLGIQKRPPRSETAGDNVEALTCLLNEQGDKIAALERGVQGLLDRVRRLETTR